MTLNDAFDGLVVAPWDDDTVSALMEWQGNRIVHPYTCPRDHRDLVTGHIDRSEQKLEATDAGWICPSEGCGYTQRWAHAMSADRRMLDLLHDQLEDLAKWSG